MSKSLQICCNEGYLFNFTLCIYYFYCSGKPLNELVEDFDKMSPKHDIGLFLNLTGHADSNPGILMGKMFDYRIHLDFDNDVVNSVAAVVHCVSTACMFYEHEKALEWVELVKSNDLFLLNLVSHANFIFYECLLYAALARNNGCIKKHKERIDKGITLHDRWSKSCRDNFQNKLLLLKAEIEAIEGNEQAIELCEEAISLSKKHGFMQEEALAYERAGIYPLDKNAVDGAYQHLFQSCFSYRH